MENTLDVINHCDSDLSWLREVERHAEIVVNLAAGLVKWGFFPKLIFHIINEPIDYC